MRKHGASHYRSTNNPCRCGICTTENRKFVASRRATRREETRLNGGVAPIETHNNSTYSNWGCRCADCCASHLTKMRHDRRSRLARTAANGGIAPLNKARHGRRTTYTNWRCRCNDCVAAVKE